MNLYFNCLVQIIDEHLNVIYVANMSYETRLHYECLTVQWQRYKNLHLSHNDKILCLLSVYRELMLSTI